MKAQRLLHRLKGKLVDKAPSMTAAEIEGCLATFTDDKELSSIPYRDYEMVRMGMEISYSIGMYRAYQETIELVEDLEQFEREGNIRRAIATLKDNGVCFKEESTSPFGYPNYRIIGLPEDVKL